MQYQNEVAQTATSENPGINIPIKALRLPMVVIKTGMSRAWIYEKSRQGSFPRPFKLGGKAVAWQEHEIDQWMADQVQKSREAA